VAAHSPNNNQLKLKNCNSQEDPSELGVSDGRAHLHTSRLRPADSLSEPRIKTLAVDDSPIILKLLTQILEDLGDFDLVGTAPDGCRALRYTLALSPELVLMDIHLPHLNGLQATQYIKRFKHPPIVVIVSSDGSPSSMELAKLAGADGFVVKGVDLRDRLTGILQDLLGAVYANRKRANGVLPQGQLGRRQANRGHSA